jgi:hypothetical protein
MPFFTGGGRSGWGRKSEGLPHAIATLDLAPMPIGGWQWTPPSHRLVLAVPPAEG